MREGSHRAGDEGGITQGWGEGDHTGLGMREGSHRAGDEGWSAQGLG